MNRMRPVRLAPAAGLLLLMVVMGCASRGGGSVNRETRMMENGSGMPMPMAGMPMDQGARERMMMGWAPASREAAMFMTNKYGPPAEMTPTMAVWHRTGPWKRTVISHQEVPHNFPSPHPDVMEQVIDYRVPPAMFDDLAMYDGSVIVERTKGEMSARCDKEGANFLALNLAHEIATGKRNAEDARRMYADQIMKMKAGQPAPYTERLMFSPMGSSMDPDRPSAPR